MKIQGCFKKSHDNITNMMYDKDELASKTALHITTIGNYEIGWREPRAARLKRLADAFGIKGNLRVLLGKY
jgi:transcriptional regulator with XRE-family HTH domain